MPLKKRSVAIAGHATSITLENEFWDALQSIAKKKQRSVASLITQIDSTRKDNQNLSSAIRVYILQYYTLSPA